ncbi:MAG: hypothetical protein AMS24_00200 [Chlamydiae bacterium SM23_39]|nr:MAG: hypothetical protein AMS24_00200 [Chlamydiae bacterium SM23_39]
MNQKKDKINLFILITLSSAFVVSIRNVPSMAETGLHMIFFGLIAAICFFIPTALISAELATGWPKEGGVFVWVTKAFGSKFGFLASWLQWTNMLLSVISMFYFVGGSFAYVIAPDLAANKIFLISVLFVALWTCTLASLKGVRVNSLVSTCCFLLGVLLPAILMIVLGVFYFFSDNPLSIDLSFTPKNIFPDFKKFATLVLILSFTRTFTGIEASSNHAGKVINPARNYPVAIFFVVIIGLAVNLLGAFSVAIVVPQRDISFVSGFMQAFEMFLRKMNVGWIVPYIGVLVAGGAIGGANAWLMGPVKGLLEAAKRGFFPPFLTKVNKHGIPRNLLIVQGIVISLIGSFLMISDKINIAFWISIALSMMIYASMYFLMIISGIYLRYKHPEVKRAYYIPGKKNSGMWIIGSLGIITILFLFVVALFPPLELSPKNHIFYFMTIFMGFLIVFIIPTILTIAKKEHWIHERYKGKKNE